MEEAAEELAVRTSRFSPHPSIDVLGAYRAAELAEEEAERVRAHLAACPRCTEVLLDLARLDGELDDEHAPELTEADLDERWQRLEARIRRENPKEARGPAPPSNKHWQALAAGLFLAVLGLGSWSLSLMSENRRVRGLALEHDLANLPVIDLDLNPTHDAKRNRIGSGEANVFVAGDGQVVFYIRLPRSASVKEGLFARIRPQANEGSPPIVERTVPLPRDDRGTFTWAVWRRDLPVGDYRLQLYRWEGGERVDIATYDFRVVSHGTSP